MNMSKDLLYKEGYIAGCWDGVKDAVSGKVNDWQESDTASLPIKAMDISTRAYNCLAICGCPSSVTKLHQRLRIG